jgi:hypothetical protein
LKRNGKRLAATLAGLSALAGGLVVVANATTASAAQTDPSTATGTVDVTPSSGKSDDNFALGFSSGQVCPGDASSNYSVQTFITPRSEDPAAMVFNFAAPTGASFTAYLRYANGTQVKNINPGLSTADVPTSQLTGLSFKNAAFSSVSAGQYWIGVACALNDATTTENVKYWKTPLTITADNSTGGVNNFTYKVGFVPNAPTLGARTAGDGQVSVAFTAGTTIDGNPSTTGYTVKVYDSTCTTEDSAKNVTGASSPLVVTGLTNGTTYCFKALATNSVGNSTLSSTGTSTPNPAQRGAVTNLQGTPGTEQVALTWTAPSPAPSAYTITVSPNTGTGSFVAGPYTGVTGTSRTITGLTGGTLYTFTITPSSYSDSPSGGGSFTGTAAQVQATPNSNQVIGQDNSVTRPTGALLIYVKCGVYGALDSFTATSGLFPGFPRTLTLATATGSGAEAGGGSAACTLNMGTAELVRLTDDSALGGNFFTTSGRLSQVTVLDTRDSDLGWSVTATAGALTGSVSGSVSGNYVGWVPKVTATSALYATYDQVATAGSQVLPGTGVSSGDGLGDGTPNVLASAAAGAGFGEARLDARLLMLIPVTADAQVYTGSMTLSLI